MADTLTGKDLFEELSALEAVNPKNDREPSAWLDDCRRAGLLSREDALTLYLCLVPCQRIGRTGSAS